MFEEEYELFLYTTTVRPGEIVGQCFGVINDYAKFISENIGPFHGVQIKFRWNGQLRTAYEIQSELNSRPFNLHDLVVFQNTTVQSVLFSVYSRLLNVLNGMIFERYKREALQADCFAEQLKYLSTLPEDRFTSRPVLYIFNAFGSVVQYDFTTEE